jgi:hypothetical protein
MSTSFSPKDFEKIPLYCEKENLAYDPPKDMIRADGSKRYAYVTLIMFNENYISAAICLAESIIKSKSKADKICLVTPDISEGGKSLLGDYFDRLISVDYVDIPNWRVKFDPKKKYLNYVFTKFNCFNLVEYDKIILIDADALILKHPDHVFSLNAPAGVYFKKKTEFISIENDKYVLPKDGKIGWYDKYCNCCAHGKVIPKEVTDILLSKPKTSGIGGGLMLLKPNKDTFQDILDDLKKGKRSKLPRDIFPWPEQQYLTLYYSGKWTSINPVFFGLQGYPHHSILFGLQFAGDKPFYLNGHYDINYRITYIDYQLWFQHYNQLLKENPQFDNYRFLFESNINNKIFTHGLDSMKKISLQNKKLVKYPSCLPYDYFSPIKQMRQFSDLYLKKKEEEIQLSKYNNLSKDEMNIIMTYYVRGRNEMKLLLLYPDSESESKCAKILNEIEKGCSVYYTRTIHLSNKGFDLLGQIIDYPYNVKMEPNSVNKFDKSKTKLVVFEDPFKKINEITKNILKNNQAHLIESHDKVTEVVEMLLNKNTKSMLDRRENKYYPVTQNNDSLLFFNSFRDFCYKFLPANAPDDILLVGDIVLYAYGILKTDQIEYVSINDYPTLDKLTTVSKKNLSKSILEKLGIQSLEKLIYDPNNYFYFRGFKFLRLELEIATKRHMTDVNTYADFIMFQLKFKDVIQNLVTFDSSNKLAIKAREHVPSTKQIFKKIRSRYQNIYEPINANIIKDLIKTK